VTRAHDLIAPLLAAAIAALALLPSRPGVTGDDTPATEFGTARALAHLEAIAAEPHPTGSRAADAVRDYLLAELERLRLETEPQDARVSVDDREVTVRNVAARKRGSASTGAILLSAHYDSVPVAPGAGDDGAAVAALLETMRALCAGPPLRNDVIALFTDGEEAGLLGAHAFTAAHPWRKDVALALNFDARGNRGPCLMFQTSPRAAALVRAYADAAPCPVSSSVMADAYDRMPNSTDFTVLAGAGYPGLNFAFIGGYEHYHRATDTIAALDPRSLTHHGATMLALARTFGDRPLPLADEGDAVWFDPVGAWLLVYPAALNWPITGAALLLLAAAYACGARRGRVRLRGVLAGAATCVAAAIASTVVGIALAHGALRLLRGYRFPPWGGTAHDGLFFLALTLAAVAVTCALARLSRRRCSVDDFTGGACLCWGGLLLASTIWLPSAAGLIAWGLAPCAAALLCGHARGATGPRVGTYLAASTPMLLAFAPLVHLFFQGMTLGVAPAGAPLVVLATALLWPVLHRGSETIALLCAGLGLATWLAGVALAS
jgi:hypothetical protein